MSSPPLDPADIDAIVAETGAEPGHLVEILSRIQDRWHHLPEAALRRLGEVTRISPADIEGVSTFYSRFRRKPAGRHTIRVCVGTACFVKGGENIYDAFRRALRLEEDADTDRDGLFTVEKAACLGCCMLAPAVQIDDAVYGHLTRDLVPSVLRDFLASRAGAEREPGARSPTGAAAGTVALCTCTSCRASGALAVFEAFASGVKEQRLPVEVRSSGCPGISYRAPVAEISLGDAAPVRYAGVAPADVPGILRRHFRSRSPAAGLRGAASRLLEGLVEEPQPVSRLSLDLAHGPDGAFWGPQERIVTAGAGANPLDLDGYLAHGGFQGLGRAGELGPEELIALVTESGLRGRGGAGYPTGVKWQDVRSAPGRRRHVICNADEGDPGAFMDRLILESFPFRVIEGMTIAARAVGADDGIFFIRAEYPLAVSRVRKAIGLCQARGLLAGGRPPLTGGSRLAVRVVESAGAFVCGEETAMIAAIEGRRGEPRARPPYPSRRGLHGEPTLVNNVETLATVPWIVAHGARAFRAVGAPGSPGTKTFALAGKIVRGGLIEVPMGMGIRRIVEEIGGGIQGGRKLKAVQIGGPSGGCIPEPLADLPIDYESLTGAGAMMGSGGLVVLDDTDCMVEVARYFMDFTRRESCGACTCCRVGTQRMHAILSRICEGTAGPEELARLEELAETVAAGSLCGLGRTAPNPVRSTLRWFRDEYLEHLAGRCPAKRCKALVTMAIGPECIGCTRCAQRCPASAIEARPYERQVIDETRCIRCGTCRLACPSGAVHVADRGRAQAARTEAVRD